MLQLDEDFKQLKWYPIPDTPFLTKYKFEAGVSVVISDLTRIYEEKLNEADVQERFQVLNPLVDVKTEVILKNLHQCFDDHLQYNKDTIHLTRFSHRVNLQLKFDINEVSSCFEMKLNLLPCEKLFDYVLAPVIIKLSIYKKHFERKTAKGSYRKPRDSPLPDSVERAFGSKLQELLETGQYADVFLRVGEEEIKAHKLILSMNSEVFQRMFESNMKESRQNSIVDLIDIDLPVVKAMLQWMYTRQVEAFSSKKALKLYVAADRYMVDELKQNCREHVSRNINFRNLFEVFELAKLYSDVKLEAETKYYFSIEYKIILKSDKWKEFSAQKPAFSTELLAML